MRRSNWWSRASLSEGHGRALLTARATTSDAASPEHAVDGRWSVRELEARARGERRHPRTPAGRAPLHPDQEDAIVQINDSLGSVLGRDVEVTATADGYRAHVSFDSLEDALELGRRLGARER